VVFRRATFPPIDSSTKGHWLESHGFGAASAPFTPTRCVRRQLDPDRFPIKFFGNLGFPQPILVPDLVEEKTGKNSPMKKRIGRIVP
jgi:hypothetical protein